MTDPTEPRVMVLSQHKVRRIKRGLYRLRAPDGKVFDIIEDPTSGDEPGGWGYISWLVIEQGEDEPCPLGPGGIRVFPRKRDAVVALRKALAG